MTFIGLIWRVFNKLPRNAALALGLVTPVLVCQVFPYKLASDYGFFPLPAGFPSLYSVSQADSAFESSLCIPTKWEKGAHYGETQIRCDSP